MSHGSASYRLVLTIFSAALLLTACLDDELEESNEQAASVAGADDSGGGSATGNRAPTITGSPPNQALTGTDYSFTPSANDPDNDMLEFSIENLPEWAEFEPSTGEVSGTPGDGHIGEYPNIEISVTDGSESVSLSAFSIRVVATASGTATLSWTPPTQNTDGSALTDLAGYKIYWGQSENDMSNSVTLEQPGLTSYVVDELTPGTWFFATSAFNNDGVESELSNVASKSVL